MTRSPLGALALITALALAACQGAMASPPSNVPASRLQSLSRGINADNVVNNTRMAIYDDGDLKKLRSMGFTNIRVPIDPSFILAGVPVERMGLMSDGERVALGLGRLDEHMEKFIRTGFTVTLVVQPMKSFMNLPTEQSEDLILKANEVLTRRYAQKYSPEQLFFEAVNEPHYDNATWNEFAPRVVAGIRANAPKHTIIVPPAWWDLAQNFKDLTPIPDPNIVYTMHVYQPGGVTQQGAGGGHHPEYRFPKRPDSADNTEWTEQRLDAYLRVGVDWAASNHVPLIMNEFGATNVSDRDSRLAWVKFMLEEADRYHYGWAWWAYDGRLFGLNPHGKGYDADLQRLLSK